MALCTFIRPLKYFTVFTFSSKVASCGAKRASRVSHQAAKGTVARVAGVAAVNLIADDQGPRVLLQAGTGPHVVHAVFDGFVQGIRLVHPRHNEADFTRILLRDGHFRRQGERQAHRLASVAARTITVPTPTVKAMCGTLERSLPKKRAEDNAAVEMRCGRQSEPKTHQDAPLATMVSYASVLILVRLVSADPEPNRNR
jgi:hypothetical protein